MVLLALALIASALAFSPAPSGAQEDAELWVLSPPARRAPDPSLPDQFQAAALDRSLMESLLATAPMEFTDAANQPLVLSLPTPDGRFQQFAVEEAPVLSAELAAQNPTIRSYRGQGIDDPTASVLFSYTELGFKAQIRSEERNWFVTPTSADGTTTSYMSFLEEHLPGDSDFSEPELLDFLRTAEVQPDDGALSLPEAATPTGTVLRTHRLTFSTTGAYSAQFGDNDAMILASMANLVTFLNGIYEIELAVRFNLVGSAIFKEFTPRPGTASCVALGPLLTIQSAIGNGGGFAVAIITTTPHGLTPGDTVSVVGSDPLINGTQLVIAISTPTRFFINDGDVVNSTTGTVQEQNPVIDPPYCDPFTPNSPSTNINANIAVSDSEFGNAAYDVGHVLGFLPSGGSGVAGVGVVGVTGQKARGASHSSDVAAAIPGLMHNIIRHEVGHQYGSHHTFNGSRGNCGPQWGGNGFAVEPASGSTIMSYGGICGGDNIVQVQDPYFSAWSLEKFNDHLATVGLTGGAATGNNPPVVTVAGGTNTIPAQTPFTLNGNAVDPEGHPLTSIWEQIDRATAQNILEAPNSNSAPLFRSLPPTSAGLSRTFPRMSNVLSNNTNASTGLCPGARLPGNPNLDPWTQCYAEFLPTNTGLTGNRTMTFRLTSRDNLAGGGGVGSADTTVSVADGTGPFLVTTPNTAVTWTGNTQETVSWDVAGTASAPISSANVDIAVSIDGGITWQTVLAGTPNDGTEPITVPNIGTTTARVRVMGGNNVFFDVSDQDFTITAVAPDKLTVLASPCVVHDSTAGAGPLAPGTPRMVQTTGVCGVPAGASAAIFTISAIAPQGVGNLRLSADGVVPQGGVVNFISNGLNNSNTVTVPLSAGGAVDVAANNATTGVRLVVIGYYSSAGTLEFFPLVPCVVSDSRTGPNPAAGAFIGPFATGAAFPDVDVVGTFSTDQGGGNTTCNVPTSADAVLVNSVAVASTGGFGGLALGTGGTEPTENTTNFGSFGVNNSAVAVVPLDGGETVALNVTGPTGPSTHVRLVVLGYLENSTGQQYTPVNPCAAFDSRETIPGDTNPATGAFAGKRLGGASGTATPGTTTYNMTGAIPIAQGGEPGCGVPVGAAAVLVNLVAIQASATGNFRAYANGSTPTGGLVNFGSVTPPFNNSNAVVVPLSLAGNMDLFVNAPGNVGNPTVHARGVILGYYN